jgi:diguanylate cyclase (GGDEF)-like protein
VEALDILRGEMPDLVVLDVMMPQVDGVEVCRRLREDPRTRGTSVIMLTARALSADVLVGLAAGADDYVIKPFHPVELLARVKSTLRRARQMRDASPLTGLPGNSSILLELGRRVDTQASFALMHVDLDNFKAVNDRYGFLRGDAAIKLLGSFIQDVVVARDPNGFVGHIGGDDFAVICHADAAEAVASEIIARFDRAAPGLYDDEDRERAHITVPDRNDQPRDYPLLSVSIGVATTARRPIGSHVEAGEIAAQMKSVAKRQPGSAYAVDRRSTAEGETPDATVTASGPSAPSR